MNSYTNKGRNVAVATALILSGGFALDASAYYNPFATGVISNNGATASTTADATKGTLGKLDPKFRQILVAEASSGYPSTGSCNVCHGTGSTNPTTGTANNDAATNKAQAKSGNWSFFAAPVVANVAPTVSAMPGSVSVVGDGTHTVTVNVTAADSDGTVASLAASNTPTGSTWTSTTPTSGTLTWIPTTSDVSANAYTVTFTAKDNSGASSQAQSKITVTAPATPVNEAPVLTVPLTVQTVVINQTPAQSVDFDVTATDPELGTITISSPNMAQVTGGTATLSPATLDANNTWTSHFSWTPTTAGTFTLTFTATDDGYNGAPSMSTSKQVTIQAKDTSTVGSTVSSVTLNSATWATRYRKLTTTGVVKPLVAGSRITDKVTLLDANGVQVGQPFSVNQRCTVRVRRGATCPDGKWSNATWTNSQALSAAPACKLKASIGGAESSLVSVRGVTCTTDDGSDDDGTTDDSVSSTTTTTTTSDDTTTSTSGTGKGKGKKK